MKIGIIGIGMLGRAVGLHLLDSGFSLVIYNRTRQKTKDLEDMGATVADSPMSVAQNSELVIIIVKDADAVNKVVFGKDGIIKGKHKSLTIADMSTISPFESRNITERLAGHGIKKLDLPVMGGPNVAISGDLVVIGSGDNDKFERYRKIFEKIGSKVFYLGDNGAAHTVKLAMNLQITMLALALSEGMILVEKAGIKPEKFLKVLNSTYFKTGMSQNKAYKMINGDHNPTFTLENLKKDISAMTDTAVELDVKLPMIKKAEEIYQEALDAGMGDIDYTGIISHIRKINKF